MGKSNFVTAINCMDGRMQKPVIEYMEERFGPCMVDMVTEPGPDGLMAGDDEAAIASIRKRVEISVNGHGSRVVMVTGHYDCAGNPGPREMHEEHVAKSVDIVKSWNLPVKIIAAWVGEDWKVEVLSEEDLA